MDTEWLAQLGQALFIRLSRTTVGRSSYHGWFLQLQLPVPDVDPAVLLETDAFEVTDLLEAERFM